MLYYRGVLCGITVLVQRAEVVIVLVALLVLLLTLIHWKLRPLNDALDRIAIIFTNICLMQILLCSALLTSLRGRMSLRTEQALNSLIVAIVLLGLLVSLVLAVLRLRIARRAHNEKQTLLSMPLLAASVDEADDDGEQ